MSLNEKCPWTSGTLYVSKLTTNNNKLAWISIWLYKTFIFGLTDLYLYRAVLLCCTVQQLKLLYDKLDTYGLFICSGRQLAFSSKVSYGLFI
jgi:hypothetical protein